MGKKVGRRDEGGNLLQVSSVLLSRSVIRSVIRCVTCPSLGKSLEGHPKRAGLLQAAHLGTLAAVAWVELFLSLNPSSRLPASFCVAWAAWKHLRSLLRNSFLCSFLFPFTQTVNPCCQSCNPVLTECWALTAPATNKWCCTFSLWFPSTECMI